MAYTTAAKVKAWSEITAVDNTADGDLTTKWIPRAERIINAFTQNDFNLGTEKTIKIDGSGGTRQGLPERLVSLTQLRFLVVDDGSVITASEVILDVHNYNWFLLGGSNLHRPHRVGKKHRLEDAIIFPEGRENIEITGTFGYAAVPQDVEDAANAVVESLIVNAKNVTGKQTFFKSEKLGDYSYTKEDGDKMGIAGIIPMDAKLLLRNYKRPLQPVAV